MSTFFCCYSGSGGLLVKCGIFVGGDYGDFEAKCAVKILRDCGNYDCPNREALILLTNF